MQLKAGTLLQGGKYEIVKTLGQGGFGITYEAIHLLFGQKVALKEFFMKDICNRGADTAQVSVPSVGSQELAAKFKDKFIKEARMMFKMNHPNIVRVLDVFEENDTAYYVMENLPGGSLSDKVKSEGPLPEALAEKYIRQVADALDYIHSLKTVHLDVKPSNILLNAKGEAVLIDFGISKHYDKAGDQTSSTPVGYSPGYAPLEQMKAVDVKSFTPATDIYSLGATMYYLVTGSIPPDTPTLLEDGLTRPSGVSDNVWNAIERSMQPARKNRPQSISEFLCLLDAKEENAANDEDDALAAVKGPAIEESKSEETVVAIKETEQVHDLRKQPTLKPLSASVILSRPWRFAVVFCLAFALVVFFALLGKKSSSHGGHKYVDLGLSVKWATCNVGASKPEEYGNYYAWGETIPKQMYSWDTYRFGVGGSSDSFFKYSNSYNKELNSLDDAATYNWGGSWRMPTNAEWKELLDSCEWTWVQQKDVWGYKVSSKAEGNTNSIFLPAAGFISSDKLEKSGSEGFYWSLSLDTGQTNRACSFSFKSDEVGCYFSKRFFGFSVRPVTE